MGHPSSSLTRYLGPAPNRIRKHIDRKEEVKHLRLRGLSSSILSYEASRSDASSTIFIFIYSSALVSFALLDPAVAMLDFMAS